MLLLLFFYINHWFNVSFKKNCLFVSQILFGKSARTTPHVVQQIKVKFASNLQCRENASKPATITDKVICAGNSTGNRNACKGDRCSPIVVSKIFHMRQFAKLSSKCEDHFFNSSNSKPRFTNISNCMLFKDEKFGHVLSSSAVRQNRHVTFWTGRSGQLVLTNDMCSRLVTN